MERPRADDDDSESSADRPSRSALPLAKFLNLRRNAGPMFAPRPKEARETPPPPPPVLSPAILRVERPMPPPVLPHQEVAPQLYYPAEAAHASELDDDDTIKEDDDVPVVAAPVIPREVSYRQPIAEWQSVPASVPEVPVLQPFQQEYRDPLPVYEVHYANPADVRTEEPWTPPAPPVPPHSRPASQPTEFAFFDRRTDVPETPVSAGPPAPPEAPWQQPHYYQPEASGYTAPAAQVQDQAPEYRNYAQAEIRRLRNSRAAELLFTIAVASWLNHKVNKQHRQNERAFRELHREHAQQTQENYHLQHQVAAQGQRLEQLAYAQQHSRSEQQPVMPDQAEQAVNPNGLQAGQRIEHSWYNEVVGADGKVVTGAIEHGRAYHEERQAESAGYRFAQQHSAPTASTAYDDQGFPFAAAPPADPLLGSGQVNLAHSLPSGQVADDHLLEERKPFRAAVSNPWIWVGLAILLFAFFSTAFF